MRLLSLILEIRYKSKTKLVKIEDKRQQFIEAISQEKVQPPPDIFPNLQHQHEPTKTIVVLQEDRIAITIELPDESEAKERLTEVLRETYTIFAFKENKIERIGVRVLGLKEWNASFSSLLSKYKECFYQEMPLINESSDIGVNLCLKDKHFKVNFNSGPMKTEQGLTLVTFKNRSLPHDFVYTDIDRYDNGENVENSFRAISSFVNSSIEYSNIKSTETLQILEG